MQSVWHLISRSFSLEWCVGTFLSQGNVDTIRSNQFIFPSPLTHLAEKTSPHANSNRGTERGGGEATYNLSKSGTLFFFNQKSTASKNLFLFALRRLFNSANYSCLCTDLSSSLRGELLWSLTSPYVPLNSQRSSIMPGTQQRVSKYLVNQCMGMSE